MGKLIRKNSKIKGSYELWIKNHLDHRPKENTLQARNGAV